MTNNRFVDAYVACALWSSMDNSNEQGGDPLDKNHGPEDIAAETLARMRADCEGFQKQNALWLDRYYEQIPLGRNASSEWTPEEQAGHDFWLSRNGHGAGFFDRDVHKVLRDQLQEGARKWGEFDLYVGDDGKIYHL